MFGVLVIYSVFVLFIILHFILYIVCAAIMDQTVDDGTALLDDMLLDRHTPVLRPIPGPSLRAIDWSGSDCDMSWICLLIFILALCFVIPLVYVVYLAEHPHHNHSS